jgi:mRNA-degrading endonuclease toxin of MazEF toxin-antitoxin module
VALQQGSIVWIALNDQAGRNPKCRPAVVITPTECIVPGSRIDIVAAAGTFSKPLPTNRIPLPWQRGKHPVTGLYKECVAVCDWLDVVEQSDVVAIAGICPTAVLSKILASIPRPRK